MFHPVVSPDGRSLAFALSRRTDHQRVGALDRYGGAVSAHGLWPASDFITRRLSWSSDGRFIFAAVGEGDADVVLLDGLLP